MFYSYMQYEFEGKLKTKELMYQIKTLNRDFTYIFMYFNITQCISNEGGGMFGGGFFNSGGL